MTPEAEVAVLKAEIRSIQKLRCIPGNEKQEPKLLTTEAGVAMALIARCRRILEIQGSDFNFPKTPQSLMEQCGFDY